MAAAQQQPVQGKGGKSKVVLARLDYRLLHGQVVFSWINTVGANRIIIVDNDAATNDIKKNALKLAKPSGVYLNIFTVEKALSKMAKLDTLGDSVMFVFGNTKELLEFSKEHQFDEVNYGATANTDGAEQIGGSGSSVFLTEEGKKDTQELLDLGTKVYVQQTPTHQRVNLNSL
ncbi:MAG: PTS sugar transporter subunit IIB [Atopobium sp.]|nr:PTS sugar transporter subunit IIB [Atopobium sp.]